MSASATPLARLLAGHTREGELGELLDNERVRCLACGHRCLIPPGREGICKVRYNEGGALRVPFGYVSGLQLDPVVKDYWGLPVVRLSGNKHAHSIEIGNHQIRIGEQAAKVRVA